MCVDKYESHYKFGKNALQDDSEDVDDESEGRENGSEDNKDDSEAGEDYSEGSKDDA